MKKLLKKSLSILLLGAAVNGVFANGLAAEANAAWKSNSTGWWYTEGNSYVKSAWRYIDGKWYYFDSTGYMKTGWLKDGQDWYFLSASGEMKTGWVKDGQFWYYMSKSGAMKTGWLMDGEDWYYLSTSGAMKTGWVKDGQDWYYMGASGAMKTGWIKDGANWYYLDPCNEGKMAADQWMFVGYHLNSNGVWDKTAKYLRSDIFKDSGETTTEKGKVLYQAGDPSPLCVVNNEPCILAGTSDNELVVIGLNTLNVYGDNDEIIDKVVLK